MSQKRGSLLLSASLTSFHAVFFDSATGTASITKPLALELLLIERKRKSTGQRGFF
jgi:hypothetical protein